jgi:hypothetical protein
VSAGDDELPEEPEVPVGRGNQLARWSIDAMSGVPASPKGLDPDEAKRLNRVNAAIEALQAAAREAVASKVQP